MIRVAINGYGRIGRNVLRAYYERPELRESMSIVAINDLGDAQMNAHLTRFDTAHGRFAKQVDVVDGALVIDGDHIIVCAERDPANLPWADLGIDVVFECTGRFTDRASLTKHLEAGAKKAILSAPGKGLDATIVYGINHESLKASDTLISNASCTTNCLAPLVAPLHDALGVQQGFMTTVHAYTNDQSLSDAYHSDAFRARAAAMSMIPTKTGAAAAIGEVIPELKGKLDGMAVRVPTLNVSLVDFTFLASRDTSVEEVNQIMADAVSGDVFGVLSYNAQPLVSVDFNHTPYSSNFDANHTRVDGRMVKVLAWYDNEWGFSNRMLDNARYLMSLQNGSHGEQKAA
jgi:glyceraldehyde 3-phosphate dehydrogenase